ncbi:hypothetical protein psyc5s11_44890 [Clostridium gelidum]|uniref:Phage protein n=1 Tax=Clostridium gelidum TaxID=704125 RepID=A0ABM7T9N8_9CLOT|nr:hypothetical protein [Clostridium gelidum]BCZ48422.1 hypothetical protein psyc5s11_44890 [Clostridium gelidum]
MNNIGIVSDVNNNVARVTLQDMDNAVTDWLPINSINISVGDQVVICFYNQNLKDGVIVEKVG